MRSYCSPGGCSYDPEFKVKLYELWPTDINPEGNKKAVMAFCEARGHRPSGTSKDPEERRLGRLMQGYRSPGSSTFDPAFKDKLDELWSSNKDPEGNKKAILAFCESKGRRPSCSSDDPEERRLENLVGNYCSPGSAKHDPAFRDLVRAYPTSKDYLASKKKNKDSQ